MSMQPIVMKLALFRGDFDQARSQYSLLWLMEALVRINQSHIRQFRHLAKDKKVPAPYPLLYRAGVHYEPEAGTEEWLDIPHILDARGGTFPGSWGDCLPLSTLVVRDDYKLMTIAELAPGDKIVGDGGFTTVVEHAITGKKTILAFDLDNGCTLRCSPNHRLFLEDGREVRAEKIKIGDRLRTPTKPFPASERSMFHGKIPSEDMAWLLGTYVADGWHDFPRHPRFSISGRDGKPKEQQKKRVQAIMERAGVHTRWNERYIAINDASMAAMMASCGSPAYNKKLPFMAFTEPEVLALLDGLKADAAVASSGTVVHGTTSPALAVQLRLLYRMLGQSVHIRRWDDHGGLGTNPIYRINVRTRVNKRSTSAGVKAIREQARELCADITTDTGRFYLPEADVIVHNCEDLACWRTAELREDPHRPVKAKPFAKWRRKPDGAYAYHALTLLPDGRLEDPSLVLGMGNEPEFARLRMAERYKEGSLTPTIRYAQTPDVVVVDSEKKSGFGKNIKAAQKATGLHPPAGAPVTGLITGKYAGPPPPGSATAFPSGITDRSNEDGSIYASINGDDGVAAWGFDIGDVNPGDMRALEELHRGRVVRRRLR